MNTNISNNPALQHAGVAVERKTASATPSFSGAPVKEITNKRFISILSAANKYVSSPEQRLIMGVTALFSQPFIDLNNKRVNEDTRLMSCARTLAKIVVGTTVGVLVRKSCIKIANKYTKMALIPKLTDNELSNVKNLKPSEVRYWAVPAHEDSILSPPVVRTYTEDYHKNYVNALGSIMGIGVSLITNFLIDAPLTQIMANGLYKYFKKESNHNEKPVNLLEQALEQQQQTVASSVKSDDGNTSAEKASHDVAFKGIIAKHYTRFEKEKLRFWINGAPNPGEMLLHTGALGWAASSAAQITGIMFNKKIDENQKKFLIPQELGDAAGNIALYYIVTLSIKNYVESLFEKGKIRIKPLMNELRKEYKQEELEKFFADKTKSICEHLKDTPKLKDSFMSYKNGASIIATLFANVIAGNILTPYFRNFYGAFWQDRAKKRAAETNDMLFKLYEAAEKKGVNVRKNRLFDKFNL